MTNKIKHTWNPCEEDHKWCDPINEAGFLYRTQYLVLSRTLLEAMPKEWQHRFVAIIDEIDSEFDFYHHDWPNPRYIVKARGEKGRIISDPWGKYSYPNQELINKVRRKDRDIKLK